MNEIPLELYRKAYRDLTIRHEIKSFRTHLIVYLIFNTAFVAINIIFSPGRWWSLFAIMGWGTGVALHYLFRVHDIENKLRKTEALAESSLK